MRVDFPDAFPRSKRVAAVDIDREALLSLLILNLPFVFLGKIFEDPVTFGEQLQVRIVVRLGRLLHVRRRVKIVEKREGASE